MSNLNNSLLLEWAYEIASELEGTFVSKAIHKAIEDNDLMEVRHLIIRYSADASAQHFHDYDVSETGGGSLYVY